MSSGNHSVVGVGFILEPEPIPCCRVCLLSPRRTLFLTDGIFFFKNESPGGVVASSLLNHSTGLCGALGLASQMLFCFLFIA